MDHLKKVGDQYALPVYLLDNSFKTILVAPGACVGDVVSELTARLGFRSEPSQFVANFCLCDCKDGVTLSRPLRMSDTVSHVMSSWPKGGAAKFVYRVKLFTSTLTQSTDKQAVYLSYVDAVYNVVAGLYPVGADEAVSLAALQCQAKYGNHKPEVHKPGYLKDALRGMIPAPMLPTRPALDWEKDILYRHSLLNSDAQTRPMALYCAVLAVRDWYGCAMFTVKQTFSKLLPTVLILGLSGGGIFMLDKQSKGTIERHYLQSLYRWGYIPEKEDGSGCKGFYFQVKTASGALGPTFEFQTSQGSSMSDLLTDYAQRILEEILAAQARQKAEADAKAAAAAVAAQKAAAETTQKPAVSVSSVAAGSTESSVAAPSPARMSGRAGGAGAPSPKKIAAVAGAVRAEKGAVTPAPAASPKPAAVTSASKTPSQPRSAAENARLAEGQAQARLAGLFAGKQEHSQQTKTWAAVKIQAAVRGLLARLAFDRMIDALEAELRAKGKL